MTAEDDDRDGTSASSPTDDALEAVLETVQDRVEPDADERAALRETAETLSERAERAATELCEEADVMQVGSSARDTWVSGDRDIDIFVRFPPDLERDQLERYGLAVGHETLPSGHEEYAEHPYVKGTYEGFDIDIVPCYRLESATEIRSAVDRTPFHNRYLLERLDEELTADVRLAKQFCKGIGVYGSNLRTRGFGGFLLELLVCEHGGFRPFLEAVCDWQPPVKLDPESHGQATFDDPLVVIDPTDPERNVAAVSSAENIARLQHYARQLLAGPDTEPFEPRSIEPLEASELEAHITRRGTTPIAVRFETPDLVDDQLYPQLRKSLGGISAELNDRGFEIFRATTFADETAVVFLELAVTERPAIERHGGPPVSVRTHAEGFYTAYAGDDDAYGPFIEGKRYVTEREREFRTAVEFLESDRLLEVGLGAHVESALEERYEVLVGEETTALCPEFGTELARYFRPRP